jgi:oligopeptide transport system substrate-binding protein
VQKARQLLAAAGYPNGAGFPPFTLTHWSLARESLIAQALQAMWQQNLGINVTLQSYDPKAMTQWRVARATNHFNAYLALNWSGYEDPQQFHNQQLDPVGNVRFTGFDDPTYVSLIRNGLQETNPAKRKADYLKAEAIVDQQMPIVSLIDEARLWLVRPYVHNFDAITTAVAEMYRIASPPGLQVSQ